MRERDLGPAEHEHDLTTVCRWCALLTLPISRPASLTLSLPPLTDNLFRHVLDPPTGKLFVTQLPFAHRSHEIRPTG